MQKKKSGFTLIEMVTVLSILAVGVSMSAVVISNLINTQNASTAQYNYSKQVDNIKDLVDDYCSYVSLNTSGTYGVSFSFSSVSEDHHTLVFTDGTADHSLTLVDGLLKITSDSSSTNDYLLYSKSVSVPDVKDYVLYYDDEHAMVKVTFSVNEKEYRHIALVRSEL